MESVIDPMLLGTAETSGASNLFLIEFTKIIYLLLRCSNNAGWSFCSFSIEGAARRAKLNTTPRKGIRTSRIDWRFIVFSVTFYSPIALLCVTLFQDIMDRSCVLCCRPIQKIIKISAPLA